MKFFTRLLLSRKNVKVNEIPKDLLTYKSQNSELERNLSKVEFYYLNNGTKLLSVLKDTENNVMEVIRVLNSLDSIFHVKFDNLFISKTDEKLLGFSYPLISSGIEPYVDMNKLANIISTPNDPEDLVELLKVKKDYTANEAKSIVINTIFWYKIFKYLNSKNISVRNLSYEDIIGYHESYTSKYIYIMNSVAKLDILEANDIEEEIEIVNLCVNLFLKASNQKVFSSTFYQFLDDFNKNYKLFKVGTLTDLSFFENMDFLNIFYNQYKKLVTFNCNHEADESFLRCPICNQNDKILSQEEYNEIFKDSNLKLENNNFSVYYDSSECYILIKDKSKARIDSIQKYINSLTNSELLIFNYNYVYNEGSELVAVCLTASEIYKSYYSGVRVSEVEEYINLLIDNVKNDQNGSFEKFCNFFDDLKTKIYSLYVKGLTLDVSDKFNFKDVLDNVWLISTQKYSNVIEIKPTSLVLIEDEDCKDKESYKEEADKIVTNVLFNLIKEKCNSRIEGNNVVSDNGFDIINLFNLRVVSEYKKFLKNEIYNSHIVMKCLEEFCNYEFNVDPHFDNTYIVSPRIFKSVLKEEFNTDDIKLEYEFVSKEIKNTQALINLANENAIIPEYIVYSVQNDETRYKGYWIKKQEKVYVKEAFLSKNLEKMDNKKIILMVLTYYKFMRNHQDIPVEVLCYDSTYSSMFIRYQSTKKNIGAKKYFFKEVLYILKDLPLYFSDMIPIIESAVVCSKVERAINEIYESFTNYCDVHKCWYEETLAKCPVCSKYYEFIDIEKISHSKKILYENKLYKLVSYKSKMLLKLYKFTDESTLINGKKIQELENQILSLLKNKIKVDNIQEILKIVKDSDSGKVIGILIPKNNDELMSIYDVLNQNSSTNVTYIEVLMSLLRRFESIFYAFNNLKITTEEVKDLLTYHLFYSSEYEDIYVSDYEFLPNFRFSNSDVNLNAIRNLDKFIKYLLSNSKKTYDLRTISYPTIDLNYAKEMYDILYYLKEYYSDENSKYCYRHSVYYNTEDGMCPLCMEEMDEICIKKIEDRGKQVNFGGEAFIYSLGRSTLIKAYKKSKVTSSNEELTEEVQKALDEDDRKKNERRKNVLEIIKKLYFSTKEELKDKNFIIPFPKKLVYAGNQHKFMGFAQDKVQDTISFFLFTNTKKCEELGFTTPLSLLELLIGYGEGIEYLHNSEAVRKVTPDGIVLGDVSGRNVLYSKYLKKVAIIDMDSVGIKGYPACTLTDDYSDPLTVRGNSIIKNFSFDSDWYSYAIICFYILTKVHPFDGVYDNCYEMPITERKEKKISVIGKYKEQISLPSVVVDWDWMPDYLLNAFIDIFENEKRFSILNLLKRAYNEISGVEKYKLDLVNEIGKSLETTVETIVNENNTEVVEKESSKKSAMNVEILAEIMPNASLKNVSSDLIIKNGKIYYKSESEKNILCDEVLFFKGINYDSQDYVVSNSSLNFDEIYVRDENGIATIIEESNEKFIGLVKGDEFTKIYRISDVHRKFTIFHDTLNNRYLLVARDNSKSYVIKEAKILNYNYKVDTYQLESFFNGEFYEPRIAYVGNSIYFVENGYIGRLDLNSGAQVKVFDCPLATEESAIKVFSDAIIIVTDKEILKISTK